MFKKLYKKLDNIYNIATERNRRYDDNFIYVSDSVMNLEKAISLCTKTNEALEKIISSQEETIKQLTDVLCDKHKNGFFVYSNGSKCPIVINNGKCITDEITTSLSINWVCGELPNISVEQTAIPNTEEDRGK